MTYPTQLGVTYVTGTTVVFPVSNVTANTLENDINPERYAEIAAMMVLMMAVTSLFRLNMILWKKKMNTRQNRTAHNSNGTYA